VGTCHAMGGHRSPLMGMVWVWVQIRRKMLGSGGYWLVPTNSKPMRFELILSTTRINVVYGHTNVVSYFLTGGCMGLLEISHPS